MNDSTLYGDQQQEKFLYGLNIELGGTVKASDCTECGQCEAECPQLIQVPKRLADAVDMFED